ncbi:Mss4-like protein [Chaetomium sp. MPI-SDFR-AT-0129]|nr:Mss4-like protein [Chaetomium sp. MPI-SDFR-AT-0129]
MRSPFFRLLFNFSKPTRLRPSTFWATPRPTPHNPPLKSMVIPFFSALFGSSSSANAKNNMTSYPDERTPEEWRAILSPEQFRILREKGTEAPTTGAYDKHYPSAGTYACAGCGTPLYTAQQKFSSGCGWPAYFDSIPGAVVRHEDRTLGMLRTEIVCANCGGHLGHVFKGEGFPTPTNERHCVNSVSLTFKEDQKESEDGKGVADKPEDAGKP